MGAAFIHHRTYIFPNLRFYNSLSTFIIPVVKVSISTSVFLAVYLVVLSVKGETQNARRGAEDQHEQQADVELCRNDQKSKDKTMIAANLQNNFALWIFNMKLY